MQVYTSCSVAWRKTDAEQNRNRLFHPDWKGRPVLGKKAEGLRARAKERWARSEKTISALIPCQEWARHWLGSKVRAEGSRKKFTLRVVQEVAPSVGQARGLYGADQGELSN